MTLERGDSTLEVVRGIAVNDAVADGTDLLPSFGAGAVIKIAPGIVVVHLNLLKQFSGRVVRRIRVKGDAAFSFRVQTPRDNFAAPYVAPTPGSDIMVGYHDEAPNVEIEVDVQTLKLILYNTNTGVGQAGPAEPTINYTVALAGGI